MTEARLTLAAGRSAVALSREAVDATARSRPIPEPVLHGAFTTRRGAFVTLNTHPVGELRGCVGFVEPMEPLGIVLVLAAQRACHDPRFEPLSEPELETVTVEVSALTRPEPFRAERALLKEIVIGRDGLIVERNGLEGLLLPQVAVEHDWPPEEFLSQACMKAGLEPDAWLEPSTRLSRFAAQIFGERSPRGDIVEMSNDG